MTSYYYCCSLPLEVGAIIRPGNWGRILRKYSPQISPSPWLLTRELIWESVRAREFAEKPSRFDSAFVCLSEENLNEFRMSGRTFDMCYEVELMNPNAPQHIGDWALANMQNTDDFSVFEQRARLYWQGQNIVKQELVTLSPIRVMRIIG